MNQSQFVTLRVYRGPQMAYDATGKAITENYPVTIHYNTMEWRNFLANLRYNGYCKVDVERVETETGKGKYEPTDDTAIKAEVDAAFNAHAAQATMTPEQQRIADLEAKLKAMQDMISGNKAVPTTTEAGGGDDIEALREEYGALSGEIAKGNWSAKTLKEKIAELKN